MKSASHHSRVSVANRLRTFLAKFDPRMAKMIRSLRAALRKRYPTLNELVWDNYNFFVIAYSPTERPSDTYFSLAANAKGVGLSFYHGADLPDPQGILEGSGTQNRFVRLKDGAATLADPAVAAVMNAAVELGKVGPPKTGAGKLIIRAVSAKQRPRK